VYAPGPGNSNPMLHDMGWQKYKDPCMSNCEHC